MLNQLAGPALYFYFPSTSSFFTIFDTNAMHLHIVLFSFPQSVNNIITDTEIRQAIAALRSNMSGNYS
jgi:hypothetical protein